jgi:hypothetical protein
MFLSLRSAATNEMIAMLYMAMRWYQHNLHGAKPTFSLKYKLPTMAPVVIMQMIHKPLARTWVSHAPAHDIDFSNKRAARVMIPAAKVARAKMAENSSKAS